MPDDRGHCARSGVELVVAQRRGMETDGVHDVDVGAPAPGGPDDGAHFVGVAGIKKRAGDVVVAGRQDQGIGVGAAQGL